MDTNSMQQESHVQDFDGLFLASFCDELLRSWLWEYQNTLKAASATMRTLD